MHVKRRTNYLTFYGNEFLQPSLSHIVPLGACVFSAPRMSFRFSPFPGIGLSLKTRHQRGDKGIDPS